MTGFAACRAELHAQAAKAQSASFCRDNHLLGIVGVFRQFGEFLVVISHLVEAEVQEALLAAVGGGNGLVEVTVHGVRPAIVGGVAIAVGDLQRHPGSPRGVCVVDGEHLVISFVGEIPHPRTIGRVETRLGVGVLIRAHHVVILHGQLGIFLGIGPVFHGEIGASLQAIDHREVRLGVVGALVSLQVFLGLVQVGQDERPHLLVGLAGIVGAGGCRGVLVYPGHGLGLWILGVGLVGVEAGQVLVHGRSHGVGDARSALSLLAGFCSRHGDDGVAVLDPGVVHRPGHLAICVTGTQCLVVHIPGGEPVVAGTVAHHVLAHHVVHDEHGGHAEVIVIAFGIVAVIGLAVQRGGDTAHEVVKGARGRAGLAIGDVAVLWLIFLYAARGERECANHERGC